MGPIYKTRNRYSHESFKKWGNHVCYFEIGENASIILKVVNACLVTE